MKKKTYYEKLKDPRWQKLRLEVMERDSFTCIICQSKTKTLNVHHLKYRYGIEPWEYDIDELTTMCEDCHKDFTERTKYANETISQHIILTGDFKIIDLIHNAFWISADALNAIIDLIKKLQPKNISQWHDLTKQG